METSTTPKLIALPLEVLRKDLPDQGDIPGVPPCFRTDPKWPDYERQEQYDKNVLDYLAAKGMGRVSCPKEPEWFVVALVGGIYFASTKKLLDPESCRLISQPSKLYYGLWQLTCDATQNPDETSSPDAKVNESLMRWLCPAFHAGRRPVSDSYTDCRAAEHWRNTEYCPGNSSFGQLALWAYVRGEQLERVFSSTEKKHLDQIAAGIRQMRELLWARIRPRYHW